MHTHPQNPFAGTLRTKPYLLSLNGGQGSEGPPSPVTPAPADISTEAVAPTYFN